MKWMLGKICIFLSIMQSFLSGEIHEIKHFYELEKYVQPEMLILLDIDDTLLIPGQMLGTDEWLSYKIKQYSQSSNDPSRAFQSALQEWVAIRLLTDVELVEEGTDQVIQSLQNKKIAVMGLTTQGPETFQCTLEHLRSLQIDLSKTAPFSGDLHLLSSKHVLYHTGILFTNGSSKGRALMSFLEKIDHSPSAVLFVDDKKHNLEDVERTLSIRGIPFIGLRYAYTDGKKEQFDSEIAEIQWNHSKLTSILTDHEAREILKAGGAL